MRRRKEMTAVTENPSATTVSRQRFDELRAALEAAEKAKER